MTKRMGRALFALAVAACTTSCGANEPPGIELTYEEACALVPGCGEPRFDLPAARETIYRVQLIRAGSGEVRIGQVQSLDVVEGDGVPLAPLSGSHLLVALDGSGAPLDAHPFRFAEEIDVSVEAAFTHEHVHLTGVEVDAIGYLRASEEVAELIVVEESGTIVARTAPPAPIVSSDGSSPAPLVSPSEHCGHVVLLEGETDRAWATNMAYYAEAELLDPGPTQRAVVRGALELMTPLLCHAVSRIAIGHVPSDPGVGGVVRQLASGDLMLINTAVGYEESDLAGSEEQRLRMMHTIIHEAGHMAEALLNAEGTRPSNFGGDWFAGEWDFVQRTVASDTLHNVRLDVSLFSEWHRTHQSFVAQGWALPWADPTDGPVTEGAITAIRRWDAAKTAESGFMSRYGASYYAEDIADLVAWTYMAPHFRAAGIPNGVRQTEDFGCQEMRAHGERSVPSRLSALYTKLMFLKDLGLVHPDDVEECTGANLGLPVDSPGFHVWQEETRLSSFDTAVTAIIGTLGDRYVFEMTGNGEATFGDERYPATFRLLLDLAEGTRDVARVPWPRGVYPLSMVGPDKLELRLDGAGAGDFDVREGFALVAEASNERIAGSVFFTQSWRPHAPVPVPEVHDPPLIVRFLIEN